MSEVPTVSSTHSSIDDVLFPTKLNPLPSSDATGVMTSRSSTLQVFEANQVPHEPPSGLVLVRRNSFEQRIPPDINPSISIASSFLPPTIPPEPQIPLSFLGDDRLQVQISDTEATDLDMRSYVPE